MTPRRSLFGFITAQGRLRNRWAKALAERDPARSASRLRALMTWFSADPARPAALWVPFVTSMLHAPAVEHLTEEDLRSLEETGARIARQTPAVATLTEVWMPVVAIRDARGERRAAGALLSRLYRSEGTAAGTKAGIVRELVSRRATGDDALTIYIEHLRGCADPLSELDVLALLAGSLASGIDADRIRIKRAGELAERLRAARIAIAGTDLALGFHALVIDEAYARASEHFEAALRARPGNEAALTGLLCACVRVGEHRRAASVPMGPVWPSARVHALVELARILDWLDDPSMPAGPAIDAATLAGLDLAGMADDWRNFALGRLYLLEGDANRAADLLRPLAEAQPGRHRWGYHAAWAAALTDERHGVARRFAATAGWTGRWTVACLLLDADPPRAVKAGALRELEAVPAPYTEVVELRAQLATGPVCVDAMADMTQPQSGGVLEEDMEALRTLLGLRYVRQDHSGVIELMAGGIFRRLPRAEQLLWSGLSASLVAPEMGRADLERAHAMGYPRATLVLAAHCLQLDRPEEARRLLAGFAWRTDSKLDLLRTWAAPGRRDLMAAKDGPRARYAMGNLRLEEAAALYASDPERAQVLGTQAAAYFQAAIEAGLEAGVEAAPADARVLASCAGLIGSLPTDHGLAVEDCARHWPSVRKWSTSPSGRWATWLVAVSRLVRDGAAVDPDAVESLFESTASVESSGSAARAGLVAALARACLENPGASGVKALAQLLERQGAQGLSEARRSHGQIAAAMARHSRSSPLDLVVPYDPAVALVAAEAALCSGDRAGAARCLRDADPGDDRELLAGLAGLLEGRPVPVPPPGETPSQMALAARIVYAASLCEADPLGCRESLLEAMRDGAPEDIVDLRGVLPSWCAQTARDRRVAASIVALVHRLGRAGAVDPLLLARCATAIGERELAESWWERVMDSQAEQPVREEYQRFQCHQAVQARARGDDLRAVRCLRSAAALARKP